jgi:hypothetical protein
MRNGKKSHGELTPEPAELDEKEEEILKAHVAKLVKAGRVIPGKHGPPLPLILRPGPRYPNASRGVTLDRRGR